MRIGLDARMLTSKRTGVGNYVFEILRRLPALLPDARFYLYSNRPIDPALSSTPFVIRLETRRAYRHTPGYFWLHFLADALIQNDELDVFWAGGTLAPRNLLDKKIVTTVHDLNHLIAPRTMPPANLLAHKLWFSKDTQRAQHIACNSSGTQARLSELLGITSHSVVYPGINLSSHTVEGSITHSLNADNNHNLGEFILFVGNKEPRKNLRELILAIEKLREHEKWRSLNLVLAGPSGWKNKNLKQFQHATWITDLGFVDPETLQTLYTNCKAFVFPSIYEGFGIPVLEALAAGAPVITSDTPELREAGGIFATYVKPSAKEIARSIATTIEAQPILNQHGLSQHLQSFSWDIPATQMAAVFQKVHRGATPNP